MSKMVKVILLVVLALSFNLYNSSNASAATKVMWGKTELKLGQIGKVTVLSNTSLVKLESNGSMNTVRALKKGEEFRVYSYKSNHGGLVGVGGGSFIQKNEKVKYETPSKSKLDSLKELSMWEKIKPNLDINGDINASVQLKDGNVMLIGNKSSFIYNYKTNKWKNAASPNRKDKFNTESKALLLQDGRVFYFTPTETGMGAEIYDPKTNKWSINVKRFIHPRSNSVNSVLLPNGNVLISGGGDNRNKEILFNEIYNPKTNKLSKAAGQNYNAQNDFKFLPMIDGKILSIGGTYDLGTNPSFIGTDKATVVEIYDYQKDQWTEKHINSDLNVSEKLLYLSNDTIFFVGQFSTGIYNLEENKLNELTKSINLVDALEMQPGKVLITGANYSNESVGYTYTMETGELKQIKIPSNSPQLFLLPNGKVLVLGTVKWEKWESDPLQYSSIPDLNIMYLFSPLAK